MANNPSPFTFKGTMSYIIGRGKVAIVDPGPDDPAHIGALLDAVRNETVTAIFVTHTHRDHSPAVPALKRETGATVYAEGPHRAARPLHIGEHNPLDASADRDFQPDVALKDGEVVAGDGWTVEAVTTPGHTANHMAFAWREQNLMFSGDHVMGWATSIVAPPDGAMSDYMASLDKLTRRAESVYFPGHGPAIEDAGALRPLLHPAPQGARSLDPASPGQERGRHPHHRARELYRPRSAADRRRRAVGAGASGRHGGARPGRHRRRAGDRRRLSAGHLSVIAGPPRSGVTRQPMMTCPPAINVSSSEQHLIMDARVSPRMTELGGQRYRRCGFFSGRFGAGFFGAGRGSAGNSPMASSMSASSARTRAALVPKSLTPMREAERTSMREPSVLGAHAHHHVVAEAHDERARHRLDDAVAARRRGRARIDDEPFAFVDHRQRGAKGDGGRRRVSSSGAMSG